MPRAGTTPAVVRLALLRKYAALLGELKHRGGATELRVDLAAVKRTIGIFLPGYDLSSVAPIKARGRYVTGRGRDVLAILWRAERPYSTIEIAELVMHKHGLICDTAKKRARLIYNVGSALRHLRSRGIVRSTHRSTLAWWTLAIGGNSDTR